jgi:hypothetical protein
MSDNQVVKASFRGIQFKKETTVDEIYHLAKKKDKTKLTEIVKKGHCLGLFEGNNNAIMLLAQEGNDDVVNFLIDTFNASRNHAVEGYAMGGHFSLVKQQLKFGACINQAVYGYAQKGYIEQVNELMEQGASHDHAVAGYARRGDREQVDKLIKLGANKNIAVYHYACGGHTDLVRHLLDQGAKQNSALSGYALRGDIESVNQLIALGADKNLSMDGYAQGGHIEQVKPFCTQDTVRSYIIKGLAQRGNAHWVSQLVHGYKDRFCAVYGYAKGGHFAQVNNEMKKLDSHGIYFAHTGYVDGGYFNSKHLFYFMSLTDKKSLRTTLSESIADHQEVKEYLWKSRKINELMQQNNFTFNEARGYLNMGTAKIFLFQGQKLVINNKLSPDTYFHILSFITGASAQETQTICKLANQRIQDRIISHTSGFFSLFKSKKAIETIKTEAEARFENRLSVLNLV